MESGKLPVILNSISLECVSPKRGAAKSQDRRLPSPNNLADYSELVVGHQRQLGASVAPLEDRGGQTNLMTLSVRRSGLL
jgi:hypothetical protein